MSVRRKTICRIVMLGGSLGALAAAAPAAANPLLSGYGGPGQGTQVILGGTLLNPPGGGSGGQTAAVATSELTVATPSNKASAPVPRAQRSDRHASTATPLQSSQTPSSATPAKAPSTSLQRVSSGDSGGTLGLSGAEQLLVLFVLAALVVTGALTRQLTRRTP